MIPYPDLVAALERWRLRNGLPIGGGGVSAGAGSMPAPAPAPAPTPSIRPPAPAPRATASIPAPPAPSASASFAAKVPERAQTDEPLDLGDADVLDDELLNNEGGDFAMAFGVSSKPPAAAYDDDVPEEKTAIGLPDDPHTSPFSTESPGPDTLDADGDVLDEADDPDPRHGR